MSDTLARVPMSAQGIDPWAGYRNFYSAAASQFAPAQAAANVQKTGAETGLLGAQAGQATAQSGLIGAQTTGANIGNQQQQMLLDINSQYYGRLNNPGGATSYPDQEGQPGSAPGGAPGQPSVAPIPPPPIRPLSQPPGLPAPAIGAGTTTASATPPAATPAIVPPPGTMGAEPPPAMGVYGTTSDTTGTAPAPGPVQATPLAPPAIGGAPSPGGAPPAIGGAPQSAGAQSGGPLRTGPGGDYVPGIGALPIMDAMAYRRAAMFGNGPEAAKQAMANRAFSIHQLVQGTIDPQTGRPNPQLWNQAVRQAYYGGLIDSAQESQWYNHPNVIGNVEAANVPTGETPGFKGQVAGAEAGAKVGPALTQKQGETTIANANEVIDVPVTSADGKTITQQKMTRAQFLQSRQQPTPDQVAASNGTPMSGEDYVAKTAQGESGNRNVPNAGGTSTASNPEQFTDGTWVSSMRQAYPAYASRYTDAQLLTLKGNPQVSGQLTMDLANINAPMLSQAGLPVTAANLEMAHAVGGDGAVKVLTAAPNTPLKQLLSDKAIAANSRYATMTNTQLQQEMRGRMGSGADLPVAGVGSTILPASAGAGAAAIPPPGAGPGTAPGPSGATGQPQVGVGTQTLTPTGQAELDVQKQQEIALNAAHAKEVEKTAEAYGEEAGAIVKAGFAAPTALQRLDVLQNAASAFRPGATGPERAAALRWVVDALQNAHITPPQWMVDGGTGAELIGKEGGFLGFQMARFLGSREAAVVVQQAMSLQPNLRLTQGGYNALLSSIRQGVMRDQDLHAFQEQWLADPSHNHSITGMVTNFNLDHPVEAYASRVIPYPVPMTGGKVDTTKLKDNVIYRNDKGAFALYKNGGFVPPAGQ